MLHKNSQSRYYNQNKIYFITTVTHKRYPYFVFDEYCEILWNDILYGSRLKHFHIFGFVILPDHCHLLIEPCGKFNISEIMHNIKRASSLHINEQVINNRSTIVGEDIYPRLQYTMHKKIMVFKQDRKFRWQKSFHDHIIRNQNDLSYHINYIKQNPIKHNIIKLNQKYKYIHINNEP